MKDSSKTKAIKMFDLTSDRPLVFIIQIRKSILMLQLTSALTVANWRFVKLSKDFTPLDIHEELSAILFQEI